MKKILFSILCLTAIFACDRQQIVMENGGGEAKLFFRYGCSTPDTKSLELDSDLISDLNLLICDHATGNLVYKEYVTGRTIDAVSLRYSQGQSFDFYCIANIGDIEALGNISNSAAIESLSLSIDSYEKILTPEGGSMMSWHERDIPASNGKTIRIDLKRGISRITVRIDKSGLGNFNVKSMRLRNVPDMINLFTGSKAAAAADIFAQGDSASTGELADLNNGAAVSFLMFENLQGTLLTGNTLQSNKCFAEGSLYSQICTYLEFDAELQTGSTFGNATYRFYLGGNHTDNFDVERNCDYLLTIHPSEEGLDEVSWRIDKSLLQSYVTDINVPSSITIYVDEDYPLGARVFPIGAANSDLVYTSANSGIATVSQRGVVLGKRIGRTTVTVSTASGPLISKTVSVNVIDAVEGLIMLPENPELNYGESVQLVLYEQYYSGKLTPCEVEYVRWVNRSPDLFDLDQNGVLTAIGTNTPRDRGTILGYYFETPVFAYPVFNAEFLGTYPNHTDISISVGESFELFLADHYSNGYMRPMNYSLYSNDATISINGKMVTGVSPGTATVYIGGIQYSLGICNVTIH
ncbi:MAG: DUF4906 domain-containing protein [Bacteroidales bacterium]|nr:DUF4906 domain-containing protein [Bacteroidales bacterium]